MLQGTCALTVRGFRIVGGMAQPKAVIQGATFNGDGRMRSDDWRSDQESEIIATNLPPPDDRESAIVATLAPAPYTAIVRGKNGATGVALVEIYALN